MFQIGLNDFLLLQKIRILLRGHMLLGILTLKRVGDQFDFPHVVF